MKFNIIKGGIKFDSNKRISNLSEYRNLKESFRSTIKLDQHFYLKFIYFQFFKPMYFLKHRIDPEGIMNLEENYNNSKNVFVLENILEFFLSYLKYEIKKFSKNEMIRSFNFMFRILSKFFEKSNLISFKIRKIFNIYFNTNSKSEYLIRSVISPDNGINPQNSFFLNNSFPTTNDLKYPPYNSVIYNFLDFFYLKAKLVNLLLDTEKVCLNFIETFSKEIFSKKIFNLSWKNPAKNENLIYNSIYLIQNLSMI